MYTQWCVKVIFLPVLEDLSVWCLSSCVNHLINHSCRSDLNTIGGLPGHHVNESIRCVLTHEIRPNEMCLDLKHKATKEILKTHFLFFPDFSPPFSFALSISAGDTFRLFCDTDVMNWVWIWLLYKLLMFPHLLPVQSTDFHHRHTICK